MAHSQNDICDTDHARIVRDIPGQPWENGTHLLKSWLELVRNIEVHLFCELIRFIEQFAWAGADSEAYPEKAEYLEQVLKKLDALAVLCKTTELPVTQKAIEPFRRTIIAQLGGAPIGFSAIGDHLETVRKRLEDELSCRLFFELSPREAEQFQKPFGDWEVVIERFPATQGDIEEMNKCFALSRYPASVFHSLQVVEHGVVALGKHIGVIDPKRGWDATSRKLAELVNGGHGKLPLALAEEFSFLEQVNQCVEAMKHAWRNKVNHAEGKLTVLSSDFTPNIAEEIMMASRGFMRRLATEMPKQQRGATIAS